MWPLLNLLWREWGLTLLAWVGVYLLLCFFVRTRRVCAAYQLFPVVPGKRWVDVYGTFEDADDKDLYDREHYIENDHGDGYFYSWGLIWPVSGPVFVVGFLLIGGLVLFIKFFDNFTKTTGRSCAEAKTCKLKGNQ